MSENIQFKYFYGTEADMFTFYRIPKILVTDEFFKSISNDAKMLYGLMLDRMSLSMKNGWVDEGNRVYINFSIEDVMEYLNVGKNTAVKIIAELDSEKGIGLIEKVKRGQGKATIIYVKSFMRESNREDIERDDNVVQDVNIQTSGEKEDDPEVYISNFKNPKKQTSRSFKCKSLEVYKSKSNDNKYINNNINNNKSNLILSDDEIRSDVMIYSSFIRENLEIDLLKENNPLDADLYEEIYNLVLEIVLCKSEYIVISSNKFPADVVRSRFLKLDSGHVGYVISCLKNNTTKVANIKKYMLAALFNAPATIKGYYQAEVNYDFA